MAPHATLELPTPSEVDIRPQSIYSLIKGNARERPTSTAASQGVRSITYEHLDKASLSLAAHFDSSGIQAGDTIPILLSRSLESVASILALIRLGACFVPMDANSWSQARVNAVLQAVEPKVVVASAKSDLNAAGFPVVELDDVYSAYNASGETEVPTMKVDVSGDPELPVYIIFTSGTTGTPKGVVIPRRAVGNYVMQGSDRGMPFNLGVKSDDKVLLLFSLAFDAAWGVFFSCLCHGGHLVLSEPERVLEDAKDCTILPATPSLLITLGDPRLCSRVNRIFLGGESPSPALIERWWSPERRIFNGCGPSETTICTSMAELQPGDPIILGEAMMDTELLILNDQLEESAEGEICISGPGLASGYYKNETLTAERFITWNCHRLYRTLDRARRIPGGIVFCGREDSMVKNRGYLINLDMDVLPILLSYPGVHSAVALMHEGRLMGAVTPESIDVTEMRRQLSQFHDQFVVPDQILGFRELDRTSNGKVDLARLRELFKDARAGHALDSMSGTRLKVLQEAVAEALGYPVGSVATNCSFWDLGGNSLLAIKLSAILSQKGYKVSFQNIFASISLTLLSERLEPIGAPNEGHVCTIDNTRDDSSITAPITAAQMGMIRSSIQSSAASYMLVTIGLPWKSETGYSEKVRSAWEAVLEPHTIFRTSFDLIEGTQSIDSEYNHDWEERRVAHEELQFALQRESNELFESTGHEKHSNVFRPLNVFRLILNESNTNANLLWLVHHSLVDGWSMSIIFKQVQALLEGEALPDTSAQFCQFSQQI